MTKHMVEAVKVVTECLDLMEERSVKYGESWKDARLSSIIDYAIMKYNRVNKMSEDIEANKDKIKSDLQDMINYAVFALMKLEEKA